MKIDVAYVFSLQGVGETLDLSLRPVLVRMTQETTGDKILRLGDAEIAYNMNFR